MWPSDFPAQCPPSIARAEEIYVYRLVNNSPPKAEDFLSTRQEWPAREFKTEIDKCNACGVSVFRNKNDAEKKKQKYKPLRSKLIAYGKIDASDGVILETYESSHMTWWLKTTVPNKNFSVEKSNSTTPLAPVNTKL